MSWSIVCLYFLKADGETIEGDKATCFARHPYAQHNGSWYCTMLLRSFAWRRLARWSSQWTHGDNGAWELVLRFLLQPNDFRYAVIFRNMFGAQGISLLQTRCLVAFSNAMPALECVISSPWPWKAPVVYFILDLLLGYWKYNFCAMVSLVGGNLIRLDVRIFKINTEVF